MGNNNTVRNRDVRPSIDVYPTDYGYSYVSVRRLSEDQISTTALPTTSATRDPVAAESRGHWPR